MISKYHKKYDANKLDSLDTIDKFIEKPQITKHISKKKKIENLDWPMANEDIVLEMENKQTLQK